MSTDDWTAPVRSRRHGPAVDEQWTITAPPAWTALARCMQVDPDTFYPLDSQPAFDAKRICGRCPVAAECLAYGIDERHGVWGGATVNERERLREMGWRPGDPVPDGVIAMPGRCEVCGHRFADLGRHLRNRHPEAA